MSNDFEFQRLKQEERNIRELLGLEKEKLESEEDKFKSKRKLLEIDRQSKQNEVDNLRQRIQKEKVDFESDIRDRYMRDIQVTQIRVEERREALAQKE